MIDFYSGTPGSGKSLYAARLIRERLQRKGSVTIGNFFFNVGLVKKRRGYYLFVTNDGLIPERLMRFSRALARHRRRRLPEGSILVIIDEAQLMFNSREWQSPERKAWLSFFTQHRKYGFNMILISQFDRMIDRQVRSLFENEYVFRKVSRAGTMGTIVSLFFGGSLYICIQRWYPIKEKVSSSFFVGTKKLYDLYDSYYAFDEKEMLPKKKKPAALPGSAEVG